MICIAATSLMLSVLLPPSLLAQNGFGVPKVLKFSGGADAAVSLQFDDSMTTQLANAVPLLNARQLRATFFVNTESYQYKTHRKEWEVDVLKAGHELGNHTAHHSGAKTEGELRNEIGDCSDQLQKVYGPAPRLMSFAIPGGVPWSFSSTQLDPLFKKYLLVLAEHRNFFDEKQTDPVSFVRRAIDEHTASNVAMHGTGGEWLSTSLPTLTRLLDFLVAHRSTLWTAPTIEIYKYTQERDAAMPPVISHVSPMGFSIAVSFDASKLPFAASLYDQPLTVEVQVPGSWNNCRVTQGKSSIGYPVIRGSKARFDVIPGQTVARVVSY